MFIPKHFWLNFLFVLIKKATIIIIEDSHLEQSQRLRDRTKLENQESSSHAKMSKEFLYHKCNTMVLFGIKTSLTSLWRHSFKGQYLDYHANLKTNLEKFKKKKLFKEGSRMEGTFDFDWLNLGEAFNSYNVNSLNLCKLKKYQRLRAWSNFTLSMT